jgi:hypothetical protein
MERFLRLSKRTAPEKVRKRLDQRGTVHAYYGSYETALTKFLGPSRLTRADFDCSK